MDGGEVRNESKAGTVERTVLGWHSAPAVATPLSPDIDSGFAQGVRLPLQELANCNASCFELLYCDGLVHRMFRDEAAEFLRACFRALSPLGLLRITTVDIDQLVHGYLFDWSDIS